MIAPAKTRVVPDAIQDSMRPPVEPPLDIPPPPVWASAPRLSRRSRMRQYYRDLMYRGISLLVRWVRWLGPRRAAWFAGWAGSLGFYLQRRDHKTTLDNLEACLGDELSLVERRSVARQVFRNAALTLAESIGMSRWGKWKGWIEIELDGIENLESALAEGKGVVCPNAHFGNWEVMTAWLCSSGYPGAIVARPFKDPRFEDWITRVRTAFGIRVIQRGQTPLQMIKTLRQGGILGVMIDMDTRSSRGIFVDFFGKPAYTQVGPFALARRAGSPIVPVLCYREGVNRLRFYFGPAWKVSDTGEADADIRKAVRKATRDLEDRIRERPEQWAWFHKRWKTTPAKTDLKRRE